MKYNAILILGILLFSCFAIDNQEEENNVLFDLSDSNDTLEDNCFNLQLESDDGISKRKICSDLRKFSLGHSRNAYYFVDNSDDDDFEDIEADHLEKYSIEDVRKFEYFSGQSAARQAYQKDKIEMIVTNGINMKYFNKVIVENTNPNLVVELYEGIDFTGKKITITGKLRKNNEDNFIGEILYDNEEDNYEAKTGRSNKEENYEVKTGRSNEVNYEVKTGKSNEDNYEVKTGRSNEDNYEVKIGRSNENNYKVKTGRSNEDNYEVKTRRSNENNYEVKTGRSNEDNYEVKTGRSNEDNYEVKTGRSNENNYEVKTERSNEDNYEVKNERSNEDSTGEILYDNEEDKYEVKTGKSNEDSIGEISYDNEEDNYEVKTGRSNYEVKTVRSNEDNYEVKTGRNYVIKKGKILSIKINHINHLISNSVNQPHGFLCAHEAKTIEIIRKNGNDIECFSYDGKHCISLPTSQKSCIEIVNQNIKFLKPVSCNNKKQGLMALKNTNWCKLGMKYFNSENKTNL